MIFIFLGFLFLLSGFDFNDLFAVIKTADKANLVRKLQALALRAG